jgi:predicted HTH transcriptional regulator
MKYSDDGPITISSMQPRDLKNLIQTGEGRYLEFKKTTPSSEKIAREIAAFANTDGGIILVGVNDDKTIPGIQGYFEEEFLLHKAAYELCTPEVNISIELIHYDEVDVMAIGVPEAEVKPVYIRGKSQRLVFVRHNDESIVASDERVEVMKNESKGEGVTFEYGDRERKLFRFLNEYGEITVEKYSHLVNVTTHRSSRILVNLVSAGVLSLSYRDNVEYFTFSHRSK